MFEFTLSCKGRGKYVCPPDAGPAWRSAYEAGCDMEELEANLKLCPEERLLRNDRMLHEWFQFETFMKKIYNGWIYIKSHHVHLS